MSLKITRITLDDYRGYKHLVIEDVSNLGIIIGPNAVGKTNIIEAIQLLTSASSFRKPSWNEVISWGREKATISISIQDEKRELEHRMTARDRERSYEVNGKRKPSSAIQGTLPCILFTPDDLQLVKASSSKRRDAIDSLGVQLSRSYPTLKTDYQQALRQRNILIKEGTHEGPLFESWDQSHAIYGARLFLSRRRLFIRLLNHMKEIYQQIAPTERLDSLYIPSWERFDSNLRQIGDVSDYEMQSNSHEFTLEDTQQKLSEYSRILEEQEIRRASSLIGPHKDEISFFINGKNARLFASQGQQRTIVLAMKLAAVELVNEITGSEPVLLLDDVMSELDENHRRELMEFIEQGAQTIVTTTNLEYFSQDILDRATVVRVPIKGTRYEY